MPKKTKIKVELPKPRNAPLHFLLLEKAKSSGTHVNKKDKRSKAKERNEIREAINDYKQK